MRDRTDVLQGTLAVIGLKARSYRPTRGGRKHLHAETRGWQQTATIVDRFSTVKADDLK
jgi:hypothetical protein